MKTRRVLLKLSGEALMGSRRYGIAPEALRRVAGEIHAAHAQGTQIAVVVGGGNIFRAASKNARGMARATADTMGMLATVMNGLALRDALTTSGSPSRVMTAVEMRQVSEPYYRARAVKHLEGGRVVVLAGGTGWPYFTTDSAAALRAAEIGAEILLKATTVDGVYDDDPKKNKKAKRYRRLSYDKVLKKYLEIMDAAAISLCRDNATPIRVFDMTVPGNIEKALMGAPLGTIIGE